MFEQVKDYKSACKVLGIKPMMALMVLTVIQMLIYDSLVKMPQNMQLKRLNHYI